MENKGQLIFCSATMTILCTSIRNRNKWINNHKFIYLAVVCSFWAFLQFIYGYSNQFAIHMVKFDLNALIKRFWTIFEDFQAQSSTGSPMSKEIWHVSNCSVQRKFQFCKFIPHHQSPSLPSSSKFWVSKWFSYVFMSYEWNHCIGFPALF